MQGMRGRLPCIKHYELLRLKALEGLTEYVISCKPSAIESMKLQGSKWFKISLVKSVTAHVKNVFCLKSCAMMSLYKRLDWLLWQTSFEKLLDEGFALIT